MIAGYFESFAYVMRNHFGQRLHYRGVQVGCLAIRKAQPNEIHFGRDGAAIDNVPETEWVVDHWPSSAVVSTAESFADAAQIADDVSRFARVVRDFGGDLNATTLGALEEQIGDLMLEWLDWIADAGYVDFRAWRTERAAALRGRSAA